MKTPVADRIRDEAQRRLTALGRTDGDDLRVVADGDRVVLEGHLDDAFAKSLVEQLAREIAGDGRVTSRLRVRDEIGVEAAAKETEFRDDAGPTRTIPRPDA